jgi:predicted DCC family thiol-disulfide oxidoreductase YuxK
MLRFLDARRCEFRRGSREISRPQGIVAMNINTRETSDVPRVDSRAGSERDAAATGRDSGPILFFDGVCGLCNRFVDFTIARDRQGIIRFAPLQGETAGRLLSESDIESLSTVVLWDEQGVHRRSSAVVRVLRLLPLGWRLAGTLLWLVPRPLRDWGYKLVAANRYRLFGKYVSCRMATPAERTRFLS